MATEWLNNGEPDAAGFYAAQVDTEDGSKPQVFKGQTERAVADQLLQAQMHASRRINQYRAEQKPDPIKTPPAPAPLSAGDRMQLARDITDPEKTDQAMERILASKGVPLGRVQAILARDDEQAAAEAAIAETNKFVERTPDWYPSSFNKMALANYMTANGMAFTERNFSHAFESLQGAGLLQPRPEEGQPTTEPEQPTERISPSTSRPRTTTLSTGMRANEGRSSNPPQSRPKYTKAAINHMDDSVYKDKLLHEPGFPAAVEAAMNGR